MLGPTPDGCPRKRTPALSPTAVTVEIEHLVEVLEIANSRLEIELASLAIKSTQAHRSRAGRLAQQLSQRAGETACVAALDEQALHAMLDHLGKPADTGRHDRPPGRHVLHDGEGGPLEVRAADGDLRSGDQIRHVSPCSEQQDALVESRGRDLSTESLLLWTVARDQHANVGKPLP
jgi:hypothetical protein